MKIQCNKQEFADLIASCTDIVDCDDCVLNHFCAGIATPPGNDYVYAKLARICEIIEE